MGHGVFKVTPHIGLVEIGVLKFDDSGRYTGAIGESIFVTAEEAWGMSWAIKHLLDHNFKLFLSAKPLARSGFGKDIQEESPYGILISPMETEMKLITNYQNGIDVQWDPQRTIAAIQTATPSLEKGKISNAVITCNEAALIRFYNRLIEAGKEADEEAQRNGFTSTYDEALESLLEDENDLE